MLKKIHLFKKQETSVQAGGVTRDFNSWVLRGIQIHEIQIDELKSQLNEFDGKIKF